MAESHSMDFLVDVGSDLFGFESQDSFCSSIEVKGFIPERGSFPRTMDSDSDEAEPMLSRDKAGLTLG